MAASSFASTELRTTFRTVETPEAGPRMNVSSLPPGLAIEQVWSGLIEDSGADVAVVDTEGRIVWVSPRLSWWVLSVSSEAAVGRSLHEVVAPDVADERLEVMRRVATSNRPIVLLAIWRGVRTRTVIRPLGEPGKRTSRVLLVCRGHVPLDREAPDPSGLEVVQARFVDHGRLGVLTPRELEILSMIAQGMTTAAIAKKLFRSRKTVEAHRLSMGAKLGVRNRVELARIALEAGLVSADSVASNEPRAPRTPRPPAAR